MIDILRFCFSSFSVWLGVTIWFLMLFGYFKNIHPISKTKTFFKGFWDKFQENYRKNREVKK